MTRSRAASRETPGVRRRRLALFTMGASLNGISLVCLVYLTGLLSLIGDYRQELYVLPGVLLGGMLFPLLGELLRRRTRLALPLGVLVASAVGVGLFYLNTADVVIQGTDLFVRSLFCAVGGIPIAVVALPQIAPESRLRRGCLWALSLGLGPIIMGLAYSLLYAEENFSGFAWIVLGNELGILLLMVLWMVRARQLRGHSAKPAMSSPPPTSAGASPMDRVSALVPPENSVVALRGSQPPRRKARPAMGAYGLAVALGVLLLLPNPGAIEPRGLPAADGAVLATATPTARTPLQHLVLIMMENHAFDNFFGVYPDGGCAGSSNPSLALELPAPLNLANLSAGSPYAPAPCDGSGSSSLQELPNGTWSTVDPIEGYSPYHLDWDGGKMDGWLAGSGAQGLNYYTADQLAPEWDLAEGYSLADNYYSSMLTETLPNRLYSLAGFSPVINDYGPPPYVPYDQTIFGELDSYGLSWGYYLNDPSAGVGTLDSIEGMSSSSPGIGSYSDFTREASTGTLPAVSWVEPVDGGLDDQYDQEPPGNVLAGEMWMTYFVDAVMGSPEWNSTAILITYDEGGGYYDQVAPPTLDGELLGERVPMMIISPYAKEAYVSHTEMNHASQIALIDYNWGMPALNTFVADSDLPLDMFDFSAAPRAPDPLTAGAGFPVPTGFPFSAPSTPDLFPLYPRALQVPLQARGYASTGASATDLAQSSSSVFVAEDTPYTPVYLSLPVLAALLLADVALWTLLPRLPRSSRS